jgi:hypothetical protein
VPDNNCFKVAENAGHSGFYEDRFECQCEASAVCRHMSPLKKTLRVDVDLELDVALAPGRAGEPFPQIGRKIEATR